MTLKKIELRPMSRRTVVAGGIAGAAFAFTAKAPAVAQSLQKLVFLNGTAPPEPASHYFQYALKNGFYIKHGVDLEIRAISGTANALRSTVAGEVDICWIDAWTGLQARDKGVKCKVLSAFCPKLDYSVVGTKDIKTMKDLSDHSVAIGIVGGSTQSIPRIMAKKAGADVSNIKWLSVGNNAARAQSLIAKRVEATLVTSTYVKRLLSYDFLHQIADAAKELPDIIYTFEVVTEDGIAKKRKAFESFVAATREGVNWAMTNPDKAAEISVETLPDLPHEETRVAIKNYVARNFWEPSGRLPPRSLEATSALLVESGQIKAPIIYDDFVASEFTKKS
jgi:ABC-type nitrate/sulfonate/bicarbonate transport system substrate-binding protein